MNTPFDPDNTGKMLARSAEILDSGKLIKLQAARENALRRYRTQAESRLFTPYLILALLLTALISFCQFYAE